MARREQENCLGSVACRGVGYATVLKQGSDLLNRYVGGTEQNIAQAFEQAKAV